MKNFIENIKTAIFWPKGLTILISLYDNMPMEKDANLNKAFRILCEYIATLGLISIVSNIFPFTFNIYNSLYLFNSIIFMLYNVLPLVILFSLVGYMAVWLKNKSFSVAIIFFIQGIKFFFVASIVIGLFMLIGANELFVNNINIMDKEQFNAMSSNSYVYVAALLPLLLIALFVVILKPIYVYLKQMYPDNKPILNWIVVLFIVCSSAILNNQLYAMSFYPKAEAKELVKTKVLCRDISEMYIEDHCFDVIEFRKSCAEVIKNS